MGATVAVVVGSVEGVAEGAAVVCEEVAGGPTLGSASPEPPHATKSTPPTTKRPDEIRPMPITSKPRTLHLGVPDEGEKKKQVHVDFQIKPSSSPLSEGEAPCALASINSQNK